MNDDNSVDPFLIAAVQQQESQGNPYAVSSKGAEGSMQTMPGTLTDPGYGVKPAQDDSPEEMARVGRDYLGAMHNKYGDQNLTLMAYNWGPTHVDKWVKNGENPAQVPDETKNYVQKVNEIHQQLKDNQLPTGVQVASNTPDILDDYIIPAKAQPITQNTPTTSNAVTNDPLDDYILPTKAQSPAAQTGQNAEKPYSISSDLASGLASNISAGVKAGNLTPLDIAGPIAGTAANAIGHGIKAITPDFVKNALTSGSDLFQQGAQKVANAIDSPATENAAVGAGNALNSVGTEANQFAQAHPFLARQANNVGNIAAGVGAVEGVGNVLTGLGKAAIYPTAINADAATVIKGAKDQFGIDTPSSLMSSGKNLLQSVASKADTEELGGQVNKTINDIMGANDNNTHTALNSKSYLAAVENNSAAYNKVFSDIGNVDINNHIVPILSEIEKIGTPTFNSIGDAIQSKMNPDGTLPASAIKELTKVGKNGKASVLQSLANQATDRPSAIAAQNIIDELNKAVETKATPEQLAEIKRVDTRYKTMKTMEPIARQVGGGSQASIPAIQNALNSSFSNITENQLPPTQLSNYLNTVNPGNKVEGMLPGLRNAPEKGGNLLNQAEWAGAIASGNPYLAAVPIAQKGAQMAASNVASKIVNTDWYKNMLLRGAY